jgi:hypothetical protein
MLTGERRGRAGSALARLAEIGKRPEAFRRYKCRGFIQLPALPQCLAPRSESQT